MTRYPLKRLGFWLLFALAAIVSVWWLLVVPYRPGAVLESIPENAAWVSVHRAPALRWTEWRSNGVVQVLAEAAGLELASVEKELAVSRNRAWFNRLGGREVAIAYVPEMPGRRYPAWVISCWAGGYSQRMRWLFALSRVKPLSESAGDSAHPVWWIKTTGLPPGMNLSMGFREGVVVFAISPDPLAVRACLDAAEGAPFARSIRKAGIEARLREALPLSNSMDYGWLRWPGSDQEWVFQADEVTADRFSARARSVGPHPEWMAKPVTGDASTLVGLKALAEGTAEAPWPWVRSQLASRAGHWLGPLDALVREAAGTENARVVVGVFGGNHAARIKSLFGGGVEDFIQGLKVPTFVMAIPVADPAAAQTAASRFLDRMNRIKPLGLVLRPAGMCYGWALTAVEGTRGGLYADFSQSEQVAFTVAGGWLVIGSHLGALEGLVPSISHEAKASGTGDAGPASIRIDGPTFSRTMSKFLAAVSLVYMVSDTTDADRSREQVAEARHWIEALGALGTIEVTVSGAEQGNTIVIRTAKGG